MSGKQGQMTEMAPVVWGSSVVCPVRYHNPVGYHRTVTSPNAADVTCGFVEALRGHHRPPGPPGPRLGGAGYYLAPGAKQRLLRHGTCFANV